MRSGKYKQARQNLKRGQGYCCLGVLTDIYLQEKRAEIVKAIDWDADIDKVDSIIEEIKLAQPQSADALLDPRVYKWAGLDDNDPSVRIKKDRTCCLSTLNDGDEEIKRHNFKEIASFIEKSL